MTGVSSFFCGRTEKEGKMGENDYFNECSSFH